MVWKFLWNVSEKSGRLWISGTRTIQPKIQENSEEKLSGRNILIEEFSKIWIYLASSSFFRKFRKVLSLSSPKISGNSKSCFWSNGKVPRATHCLWFITRLGLDLGPFSRNPRKPFRARKAISSSSVPKNGEVYTPKTTCMKRTSAYIRNMWIKQLCNQKAWDFAMAFRVRKLFGTFEKRAPGPLSSSQSNSFSYENFLNEDSFWNRGVSSSKIANS